MEFDKKPSTETGKHVESEAPKKVKKKRKTKESQTSAKKVIKAPVRAEILAEEHKKDDTKKEEKAKKTKKKAKKAAVAGVVAAGQGSEAVPASETSEKPKRKRVRRAEAPEKALSEEPVSEKSAAVSEPGVEAHEPAFAEDTFEVTILPHETTQEEGELFLSERWQRRADTAQQPLGETGDLEPGTEIDAPEDDSTSSGSSRTKTTTPSGTASSAYTGVAGGAVGATPRARATSASSGVPPVVPPGMTSPQGFGGGMPVAANLAPATAAMPATANRYSSRTAERRSLVAGILLGGIIEHVRHKRREKRMKVTHEKETKKQKEEQQFQRSEQLKNERKSEHVKTALERQLERLKKSPIENNHKKPLQNRKEETPISHSEMLDTTHRGATQAPEIKKTAKPEVQTAGSPSSFYEEYKRKFNIPEATATASAASRIERPPQNKTHEQPAPVPKQQLENIDQPVEISPDRRVETSAWHRIEVDKKTGQAVKNPELAYGEEFQNEQHQEQLRRQIAEASMESEKVKQNYMPIIDKTAVTSVETHDTNRPRLPEKTQKLSPITGAIQGLRDGAIDGKGVDIALWIVLFFIVVAIIALL
jgi:hypothetical protein